MLALMTLLVALLTLMLSFSLWLRGEISDVYSADPALLAGLATFGLAYGLQAWAVWTLRRWARAFTVALLVCVTIAGLLDTARNEVLALGTVLVFGLGFVCSVVALLVTQPPAARKLFTH